MLIIFGRRSSVKWRTVKTRGTRALADNPNKLPRSQTDKCQTQQCAHSSHTIKNASNQFHIVSHRRCGAPRPLVPLARIIIDTFRTTPQRSHIRMRTCVSAHRRTVRYIWLIVMTTPLKPSAYIVFFYLLGMRATRENPTQNRSTVAQPPPPPLVRRHYESLFVALCRGIIYY